MKQHITVEQLNELSEKSRKKLNKWIGVNYPIGEKLPSGTLRMGPFLSIGEMIEFLDAHRYEMSISFGHGTHITIPINNNLARTTGPFEDICDALWEAVKEVLNK